MKTTAKMTGQLAAAAVALWATAASAEDTPNDCDLVQAAMAQMIQANIGNIRATGNALQSQAAVLARLAKTGDDEALAAAEAVSENLGALRVPAGAEIAEGMQALRRLCPETGTTTE